MRKWSIVMTIAGAVVVAIALVRPIRQTQAANDVGEDPSEATAKPVAITGALHWLKPQYVLGEDIFFWVSMKAEGDGRLPDPDPGWVLTVYRPDGTTFQRESLRRMDGLVMDGMFRPNARAVGCGFTDGVIGPGTYRLELRVEGAEEVVRQETEVIAWQGFDKIEAGFRFPEDRQIGADEHVPITFWVNNGSDQRVRFPCRYYGRHYGDTGVIGVGITRTEPGWHHTLRYPAEKLLGPGQEMPTRFTDRYTWRNLSVVPAVVLEAGEVFEQELCLEDTYDERWRLQPGAEYEIVFYTRLDLLVGKADGALAPACPMRKGIRSSAQFQTR